eukprot:TRINITY_DN224_c0_g2_i1.p1 TRINITY_DN224_c0_g2~~TRINITY_DN224_c0_g2_i1.p1  ORF type:complete len:475 (+),score=120.16 TRINITY_DN224_c0_g2_i1:72-1496(+)
MFASGRNSSSMKRSRRNSSSLSAIALIAVAACLLCADISFVSPGLSGRSSRFVAPSATRSSGSKQTSLLPRASRGGADAADLAVGDFVKAVCPDDEQRYPGTIDKVNSDGTFAVKWDDPDGGPETHDVGADGIIKVIIFKEYKVGEEVHAKFPDDGNMYPATVTKVGADGAFTVKWEDPDGGPEESEVQAVDMKYPPIPLDKLEVGQKYKGTVKSVLDFGAFVDINAEGQGLVHISRISRDRVENIYDYVSEDQEIDVWVSEIRDDGKFGLTMVEGLSGGGRVKADLTPFEAISPDDWLDGVVQRTAPFGAFVKVTLADGASADGLVHVSQIRDGFVENVDDEVSEGQEVKVRIQSVDIDAGKMSLSMKEAGFGGGGGGGFRAPADLSAFVDLDRDTFLDGKVARTASFGAFVTVTAPSGAQADGLVHITQIKDGFVESVDDELEVGQEVKVRVTEVDTMAGKMGLSMKEPDSF